MSDKHPPQLSKEERDKRGGYLSPTDRFSIRDVPRPWLHQMYNKDLLYYWVIKNKLMRDDETGIELTYRPRQPNDIICGERIIRPGISNYKGYSWRMDQSVDHEIVCTVVTEHAEIPHIGVPADCADMTCDCSKHGSYHLVITGFTINPKVPFKGGE